MSEAIVVALIAGGLSLLGTIITILASNKSAAKELYAKLDKQSELADEKLKARMDVFQADLRALSNRVDAHNNLIERTYALERRAALIEDHVDRLENDAK